MSLQDYLMEKLYEHIMETEPMSTFEFSLNVFTEFSDKNISHNSKKGSNLPSPVSETRMLPQHQQDTCEKQVR